MNEKIGIPRTHPDFIKARLERFCKLLKDARKILNKELTEYEKEKLKEVGQSIRSRTK
jgi:hypothetical protein